MIKINVLGSCVSRVALLDGDRTAHGIVGEGVELGYFLDKQNIICAMTSSPFSREEIDSVRAEEIYDPARIKTLKQCLSKETVSMLFSPKADYIVIDLYDMQNDFGIFNGKIFSTCAHEFFQTELFRKYANDIAVANFMLMPKDRVFHMSDVFFDKLLEVYDSDHIILNRFRSNTYYLSKEGYILHVPDMYKKPYHSNDAYNEPLWSLEEHIIEKYNPYVIDLSKYFCGDANYWDNLNGAHFEKEFYRETYDQIMRIVRGESKERYYSQPDFFNPQRRGYEEDRERLFDVESNLIMFNKLLEADDILWLNILDKLNTYAPEDVRVKQYMECLGNIS
ncbi:MAG: hypothetical protein E7265_01835 [Lachnospiraceae bacterium]|nr:hypothetical protein [Lachnospiraceae bacterium]MBE5945034.1 hypothetical protein [Lachnospiraceae bacterium]